MRHIKTLKRTIETLRGREKYGLMASIPWMIEKLAMILAEYEAEVGSTDPKKEISLLRAECERLVKDQRYVIDLLNKEMGKP